MHEQENINRITGGRAVVAGHILSNYMDIFAANERGPNFLYINENSTFKDVAESLGVEDTFENGRGTTIIMALLIFYIEVN